MEPIYRSKKFRIYPNKEQQDIIDKTLGACRFVYNYGLAMIDNAYYKHGITLKWVDVSAAITRLKELEEYKFLNEVSREALTSTLKDLNNAFINFFKKRKRYPKPKDDYKRKKNTYKVLINITNDKLDKSYINIAKLGYTKSQRGVVIPDNNLTRVTITKTGSGKYYVGIKYKVEPITIPDDLYERKIVGIDIGVHHYATLSTGEIIDYPYFGEKEYNRLRLLEKGYLRKPSNTNKHKKAVRRYAILHEKIYNRRMDFIHKLTCRLTDEFDEIHIEDISYSRLAKKAKNREIKRRIIDSSFSSFKNQLKYKSEDKGVKFIVVDKFYPSSQLCSSCGFLDKEMKDTHKRKFRCESCGYIEDRDINAAINLMKYAC